MQGYGEAPSFDLPPEIMENFRRFDVDGNNVLDPYEFATVLQELHNFTEPYVPLVNRYAMSYSHLNPGYHFLLYRISSHTMTQKLLQKKKSYWLKLCSVVL